MREYSYAKRDANARLSEKENTMREYKKAASEYTLVKSAKTRLSDKNTKQK